MAKKSDPYIFILGRKPLLSLAELLTYFSEKEIISIRPRTLIVQPQSVIKNPQELLVQLGGTVRIAHVFQKIQKEKFKNLDEAISKWVPYLKKYFKDRFKKQSSKIHFGINIYNFPPPREIFLKKLLNALKTTLKEIDLKVRFVNNKFQNIPSVAAKKEKLMERGAEINIVMDEKVVYFAETVAIQDVDRYSLRDYGKPKRDPRSGMLPPKVGQLLINFARTDAQGKENKFNYIFDPFCGTGTILMEGLLKGYNVAGSDIDKDAVEYSRKNIEWLRKEYKVSKTLKNKIATLDATKLKKNDLLKVMEVKRMPAFAVVSEPYLGPPFFKFPKMKKLEEHIFFLDQLYENFFEHMKEVLPQGTIIVFVMPTFRDKNHDIHMDKTIEKIKKLGYSVIDLIPGTITKKYSIEKPNRPSLIYEREGQVVAREIYKFVL